MKIRETDHFRELTADDGRWLTSWREEEGIRAYSAARRMVVPLNHDGARIREISDGEHGACLEERRTLDTLKGSEGSDFGIAREALRIGGVVRRNIQALDLSDTEALQVRELYPSWDEFLGGRLAAGTLLRYGGTLYRVRQEIPVVLEGQAPGTATAALYERIDETHAGTAEDPIPYGAGMELTEGRYYTEAGVLYRCIRSSGIPMTFPLRDLVSGGFVEVVNP